MNILDQANIIDRILMRAICNDMINGSLLESDDETLQMLLHGIWELKEEFEQKGIVIGEA
tara:strand:- start:6878 stop:7057 length:180 start_codon:yes stop_codon:yes gene_type:complete